MAARRVIVAVFVVLVALAAGPSRAAWSQASPSSTSTLAKAAEALRRSPVYVDPEAERALGDDEVERLAARIREEGQPVFVAVLPSSAAEPGGPDQVVTDLARRTGLSGTYAVVVGDAFRATSTTLGNADELATAAFQGRAGDGTFAVLDDFVRRVASEGRALGSGTGAGSDGTSGAKDQGADGGGSGGSLVPLVLLAGGGGGLLVWARRRRRRASAERAEREQAMAADRQLLRAQLSVLADDVMRLEPEVALHPEARNDYEAAVERYRIAAAALDYADEPIDLVRVQRVVEEASYAMARARAIIEGRRPPEPPPELRQNGRHQEPALDVDQAGTLQYAGGAPFYGGGGWFGGGGGGGLFSGLLLGSMLGGFGPFGMWGGSHTEIHNYGDGGGSGGDGDGWGGGFGGGDWGGGDWGGDIGGGDW